MNPAKPHQIPRDVEADSMNLWSDESSNYGEEEEEGHRATVLKMHTLLSTWDATDKNKNCTSAFYQKYHHHRNQYTFIKHV